MHFLRFPLPFFFLAACGLLSASFPTELPSQRAIDAGYQTIRHNLSPRRDFHFDVTLPTGWKTLDTKLIDEPTQEISIEVAAFRAPGPWMDDERTPAGAEVTVTALRPRNPVLGSKAAEAWLIQLLEESVPGYRVLDRRLVNGVDASYADILVRYQSQPGDVIARMRVQPIKEGAIVLVITASAPENDYRDLAEKLFVAIESFTLLR